MHDSMPYVTIPTVRNIYTLRPASADIHWWRQQLYPTVEALICHWPIWLVFSLARLITMALPSHSGFHRIIKCVIMQVLPPWTTILTMKFLLPLLNILMRKDYVCVLTLLTHSACYVLMSNTCAVEMMKKQSTKSDNSTEKKTCVYNVLIHHARGLCERGGNTSSLTWPVDAYICTVIIWIKYN